MISKVLRIAYLFIFAALAGCANIESLLSQPTPASAPLGQTTSTPQPLTDPTQTAHPTTEARVLRVWLPPRFDPNATTVSANLLEQRLIDFESTHPGLKIEIRIKAEEGEASLLNSLSLTNIAAPTALPDLIALSRPDLEAAALKGLLHPVDGLSTVLDDPNWYPYGRELGHIQNIGYGLPFAGDALVLIHRPELEITTWENILAGEDVLVFPASNPQALIALSLYISAGGRIVDEQGLPTLDEERLTQTLLMIQNGHLIEQAFLPAMANYATDTPSMQAYRDGRANIAIAWAASYQADDGVMQMIPSLSSTPHTFAIGWIWALAGSNPENQQVATELAEFLIADEFTGTWLNETGYLPTRLAPDPELNAILDSAHVIPSNDVLSVLGPIMNQALIRVLNGDQLEGVVRSAMEQVQ
jgi:ABC-type glycerol-3-phosphate transport system substrate-binding protein